MLKRTLTALAMVGMVAMAVTPASADLLIPDQVINPPHLSSAGTIGVIGASVNGSAVASPGFLGGAVASQVSIPANISNTIVVTFAFHWPFSTFYPVPYLGVQWQTRLNYDNSEVQVLGATGAGGWTAENFGMGPNNSKMTANGPPGSTTTCTPPTCTTPIPGTSTTIGPSGTPLKGFPNTSPGTIGNTLGGHFSTAPGFGRFAMNPPTTATFPFTFNSTTTTTGGVAGGMLLPFSSTFPIMKVTLHVKNVVQDGLVDLWTPPSSAHAIFRVLTTTTSMVTNPLSGTTMTFTNTHALNGLYYTGNHVGTTVWVATTLSA